MMAEVDGIDGRPGGRSGVGAIVGSVRPCIVIGG